MKDTGKMNSGNFLQHYSETSMALLLVPLLRLTIDFSGELSLQERPGLCCQRLHTVCSVHSGMCI